ncbi:integral membrane protein, Mpv17/PMP22 family [Moesziomyces antarcticus]|uniref:Integral membrane protein, Mpv17/PMP22 family n=2 Tax=Pseudozyma antarctica TaxID=84753 RepID=A0A081CDN0_PSEA2|nr:integral membrane protein, Mpv17/PMP22 family [Moesziomyces antarcticus]GAK64776.1 integral membrane protein, Mpv17/PMP22 family [Moesziomyces antarcticus]SPO45768.1 related to glomerulosclerosis protein Mpv17 [Moesziomyces antarcticus]
MSAFSRFIAATSSTLPRQCLTGGVLFATGDTIAQQLVEKRRSHDYPRTFRLALYGGCVFSPLASLWFGKVLERVQFASKPANIAAKVALDQGIASPAFIALFFGTTTLMNGGSPQDAKKKIQDNWWPTLKTAWGLWIPVQTINMAVVPPMQRLLFVNVVSIAWNTFLSIKSGAQQPTSPQTELTQIRLD